MLVLEGTTADLGAVTQELTAFRAAWRSPRAVDLSRPPFEARREQIADPGGQRHLGPDHRQIRADPLGELDGGLRARQINRGEPGDVGHPVTARCRDDLIHRR